jgi:uncharacterized protein (TIGR04255 family)
MPELPASALRELLGGSFVTLHDFTSADEKWSVTLGPEFLALKTLRYVQFEEFDARLRSVVAALADEYHPSFWSRVGLRYRDVLNREALGFTPTADWGELLNVPVAGVLNGTLTDTRAIAAAVTEGLSVYVIKLTTPTPAYVRFQHGLSERAEGQAAQYILDSDFYTTERVDIPNVHGLLGEFSRRAGRLFRWAITRPLHDALQPQPAPEFTTTNN